MIRRRIIAAILIYGFALGSVFFWQMDRPFDAQLPLLLLNFVFATTGFAILHFRWRRRERAMITPKKAEDIFS